MRSGILRPGVVALNPKLWMHVVSLTGQHVVIVRIRLGLQVLFANHSSLVASLSHKDG